MITQPPSRRTLSAGVVLVLILVMDDGDAVGAASVDPVLTEVWTAESDQESASLGVSVSSAGDVNGDGYEDVVVGAPYFDNGEADEGRAYLYLGSAAGLETTAAWTAESDQEFRNFGYSVSSAGDVNGDGYEDVVVGVPYFDNGEAYEGRAYLYLGSAAGLETTAAWTAESDQESALFGYSVSSAGDVNGDGYEDVVVGAPYFDNGEADEGRAYLYLGSATGLATTAAWTAESDQEIAAFGISVSSAGDVNGDGYGDVVVGARYFNNGEAYEGRAYLYLGSAAGLETTAAWTAESDQGSASLGVSVSSAGDVNGDGYDDVVVGAPYFDNGEMDEGRAYLYLGSAAGLETTAAWTAESDQEFANFGYSVSSAGDVNGDGYEDVIVGAPYFDNGEADEGRAYLYLGSAAGLETTAAWTAESDQESASLGVSVSAGDVNGDGYGDLVVGAPYFGYFGEEDEGRAYLYLGNCADADADGVLDCAGDCDDNDPTSYPGAPELCDGFDNACAGFVPADEVDADADGVLVCAGDCDDNDPTIYAGAPELCDGLDNACAGSVPADEVDVDGDSVLLCADCDDNDPTSFPGAPELCDGIDNACADLVPTDEVDADTDGVLACAEDCDDNDPTSYPGAAELCDDGVDNDCDGVVDQECADAAAADGCGGCNGSGGTGVAPVGLLAVLLVSMLRRRGGEPAPVRL